MGVATCGLCKGHPLYSPALQLKPFIQEYLSDLGQLGGDFLDGDAGWPLHLEVEPVPVVATRKRKAVSGHKRWRKLRRVRVG